MPPHKYIWDVLFKEGDGKVVASIRLFDNGDTSLLTNDDTIPFGKDLSAAVLHLGILFPSKEQPTTQE